MPLNETVGLDITAFKTGAVQLAAQVKNVETSFRASAAQMDNWSGTSNGLKERVTSLQEKLGLQRQELEKLTSAYKLAVQEQGADSKSAQSLASQMFDVEKQITSTQKGITKYTSELKSAEKQEKESSSSASKLKSSFAQLAEQSKKSTSSISSHFGSLKSSVAGAVAGIGISLGVTGLAKSIYSMAESASNLVEAQNVVENTFKESSKAVEDWSSTTAKSAGIGKTSATQMVGAMGAMLKSSGLAEKDAGDMSEKLVQLTGDMSSFYNVSTSDMWEKIRAGIAGETKPLKELGVNMDVANLSAFATSNGLLTVAKSSTQTQKELLNLEKAQANYTKAVKAHGKASLEAKDAQQKLSKAQADAAGPAEIEFSKLSQSQQAMIRYKYLLSVTADAQGDFARTSSTSMANQSRIFQMNIDSMKQSIGASFLPMVNSMFTSLNPLIQQAIPKISLGVKGLADGIKSHANDIKKAISDVVGVAKSIVGFVEDHGELVKNIIIGIVGAVVTWKVAVAAFNAVQAIHNGLLKLGILDAAEDAAAKTAETAATGAATTAQVGLNVAMSANPIGLVIAGIAAAAAAIALLAAGIVALIKHFQSSSIETQNFSSSVSKETQKAVDSFDNLNKKADEDLKQLAWTGKTVTKEMADDIKTNIDQMAQTTVDAFNRQRDDSIKALQDLANATSGMTQGELGDITKNVNAGYDKRISSEKDAQKQIDDILQKASDSKRSLTQTETNQINSLKDNMYKNGIQSLSKNQVEEQAIYDRMRINHSATSAQEAAEIVKNSKTTTDKVISDANAKYNNTVSAIIRERDETHSISSDQADKLIKSAEKTRDSSVSAATDMHTKVVNEAKLQSGEFVNQIDWQNGTVKSNWQVFTDDIVTGAGICWQNTKSAFGDVGKWFGDRFGEAQEAIKTNFSPTAISDWFSGRWQDVKNAFGDAGTWFGDIFESAKQSIYEHFSPTAISDWFSGVWDDIRYGFSALNPFEWGGDLINGLADGIRDAAYNVQQAVGNVAQNIRDFLHFSKPDVGPLADFDTYMPDMMSSMANGITENIGKLKSAAYSAAGAISSGLSVNANMIPAYAGGYAQAPTQTSQTTNHNYYGPRQEVNVFQVGDEVVTGAVKNRLSRGIQNERTTVRGALGYGT